MTFRPLVAFVKLIVSKDAFDIESTYLLKVCHVFPLLRREGMGTALNEMVIHLFFDYYLQFDS